MSFLRQAKEVVYHEIEDEGHGGMEPEAQMSGRSPRGCLVVAYIMISSLCCLAAFLAGRYTGGPERDDVVTSPVWPPLSITFRPDPRYGGPASPESDAAWSSLSPPGEGFVVVPNPSDLNLPPGKATSQGDLYDVSVFHQLHCVTKIREHASLLRFALEENNTAGYAKVISPQVNHMAHCFDYLRQSIMCAGDMTLEWPREGPNGERLVVDGWGIQHQCKSWDAISEFVAQNSVT